MAVLNRFSAILLYCDSAPFFASRCGISGDSRPAILGIVRFAIRDSVPLRSGGRGTLSKIRGNIGEKRGGEGGGVDAGKGSGAFWGGRGP